eukprot:2037237-Heterocapsa_arctica.AAC.1
MAADLLTGWDLSLATERQRVREQFARERPRLLIASPPCTVWCVFRRATSRGARRSWLVKTRRRRTPEVLHGAVQRA